MSDEALDAGPTSITGVGPAPIIRAQARSEPGFDIVSTENFGFVTVTLRRSVNSFAGVMMAESTDPNEAYDIALVTRGGDAVRLESATEDDAIAIWRAEARRFALPMVIWGEGVGLVVIEKAETLAGAAPKRRRRFNSTVRHRRPRFLTRRKTARLPLDPVVHRTSDGGRAV